MQESLKILRKARGFSHVVAIDIMWRSHEGIFQRRTLLGNILSVYSDGTFRFCGEVYNKLGELTVRVAEVPEDALDKENPPCFRGQTLVAITTPLNTIFRVDHITKIEVRKSKDNWNVLWSIRT